MLRPRLRASSGTVIATVVASLFLLVLLGIGLYFTMIGIGGHREVVNATDAGSLQVGRDALTGTQNSRLVGPSIGLSPSVQMSPAEIQRFDGLGDRHYEQLAPSRPNRVDLLSFNRLVGMALLVQMNAAADGTVAARTNANTLANLLQGGGGIGARLRAQLQNPNVFTNSFTQAYNENSKRLTGSSTNGNYVPGRHQVGYVGAGEPTNLDVSDLLNVTNSSIVNFSTGASVTLPPTQGVQVGGTGPQYLTGYRMITPPAPAVGFTALMAAAVGPVQPSLISNRSFNTASPGANVPPNAFRSGSTITDRNGYANTATAFSRTGANQPTLFAGPLRTNLTLAATATTFKPEIPRGYVTVYNNGQVMDNTSGVLGAFPNGGNTLNFFGRVFNTTNNVAARQLGIGIVLDHDSGWFAGLWGGNQLAQWKYHQVRHPGFPRLPRGIINPPHYLAFPPPIGANNPYWENILLFDSHRDYCYAATRPYFGGFPSIGDYLDPLTMEEMVFGVPAYNELKDPRNWANPLMAFWRSPAARDGRGSAGICPDGSIIPGPVTSSVGAHWVPYNSLGSPLEYLFDTNISRASPLAQQMLGRFQLDNAYWGCRGGWTYGTAGTVSNVTAAEAVKLAVVDAYGDGPSPGEPACFGVNRAFTSGLRRYPNDPGAGNSVPYATGAYANPWSVPGQQGVVSRPGSLTQLFDQVQPGSSTTVNRFLLSRMRQIKSDTVGGEVNAIMNQPLEMSSRPYYIELNPARTAFVITQNAPQAAVGGVAVPNGVDGRVFPVTRTYPLVDRMANPRNDNDIHERLFMTVATNSARTGPPNSNATEIAQFGTSSGYNLELGKITFRQDANGDFQLCDRN